MDKALILLTLIYVVLALCGIIVSSVEMIIVFSIFAVLVFGLNWGLRE